MFSFSRYLGPTPERQIPIHTPPGSPVPLRKSKGDRRRCKSVPVFDQLRFSRCQSEPQDDFQPWDRRFLSRVQKSVEYHAAPKMTKVMSYENLAGDGGRDTRGLLQRHILPISRDVALYVKAPVDTNVSALRTRQQDVCSMKLQLRSSVPTPPARSHRSTVVVSCLRHDPALAANIPAAPPKRRVSTQMIGLQPTPRPEMSSSITVIRIDPTANHAVARATPKVESPPNFPESLVAAMAEFGKSYDVYSRRFSEPPKRRKRLTFANEHQLVTTYEYTPENTLTGRVSLSSTPTMRQILRCHSSIHEEWVDGGTPDH